MLYKVVRRFGPDDGARWRDYLRWRGLALERFDSMDGTLRPGLFQPRTKEDWANCVNADYRTDLITSADYARNIVAGNDGAVLVGVDPDAGPGHRPGAGLLGYDVMDREGGVSLLTNWGPDPDGLIDPQVAANALVRDPGAAVALRDALRVRHPDDPHAGACQVWAVYAVDA